MTSGPEVSDGGTTDKNGTMDTGHGTDPEGGGWVGVHGDGEGIVVQASIAWREAQGHLIYPLTAGGWGD